MLFKDNNENLLFNKINIDNSSMIIDKDIMDFSATIDENNKLTSISIKAVSLYIVHTLKMHGTKI